MRDDRGPPMRDDREFRRPMDDGRGPPPPRPRDDDRGPPMRGGDFQPRGPPRGDDRGGFAVDSKEEHHDNDDHHDDNHVYHDANECECAHT